VSGLAGLRITLAHDHVTPEYARARTVERVNPREYDPSQRCAVGRGRREGNPAERLGDPRLQWIVADRNPRTLGSQQIDSTAHHGMVLGRCDVRDGEEPGLRPEKAALPGERERSLPQEDAGLSGRGDDLAQRSDIPASGARWPRRPAQPAQALRTPLVPIDRVLVVLAVARSVDDPQLPVALAVAAVDHAARVRNRGDRDPSGCDAQSSNRDRRPGCGRYLRIFIANFPPPVGEAQREPIPPLSYERADVRRVSRSPLEHGPSQSLSASNCRSISQCSSR
jgi:hypothetical protein